MSIIMIFLTGLTVGGLTCLAVQGGLLASVIAAREKEKDAGQNRKYAVYATGLFLIAKLVAHAAVGAVLGIFGNLAGIRGDIQVYMQLAAGLYMLIVAMNLFDVHPIFRYAIIQPPRFLARLVKNQTKSRDFFAPALLGLMTIFIPCGTTMAMEALAVSSASPMQGSLIMAVFVLGTSPLFLGAGFLVSFLGGALREKFNKAAAAVLVILAMMSIGGALTALGLPVSLPALFGSNNAANEELSQNITIEITPQGYIPDYVKIKKGVPATLRVVNNEAFSCAAAFRIPALGMGANLQPGQEKTFTFTPEETGKIIFSCSMGMYRGVIEVI